MTQRVTIAAQERWHAFRGEWMAPCAPPTLATVRPLPSTFLAGHRDGCGPFTEKQKTEEPGLGRIRSVTWVSDRERRRGLSFAPRRPGPFSYPSQSRLR